MVIQLLILNIITFYIWYIWTTYKTMQFDFIGELFHFLFHFIYSWFEPKKISKPIKKTSPPIIIEDIPSDNGCVYRESAGINPDNSIVTRGRWVRVSEFVLKAY